jgi:hypothetical protein
MPFLAAAAARRNSASTDGLLLWFDAASLSGSGPVSSWRSLTGGVVAVSPADNSRPVLSQSGLNGRPSLQFDGDNDFLVFPAAAIGSSWRAMIVCSRSGSSTYGTVLQVLSGTNAQALAVAINNDATQGPVQVSAGSSHVKGGTFGTASPRILTISIAAGSLSLKNNGTASATSSTTAPHSVSGTQSMIGGANSSSPSRFFSGSISEIRVYESLTAQQEAAEYAALAAKWGLT